tara:strand:- start:91 stop:966 length:876 start_codon:yes stop_codon:yes gene_type:complete
MIRRLLNFFNFKKKNINSELQDLKLSIGQIQSKLNVNSLEKNIKKKEFKVFSQWGEDGIIDYLISNLDIENKTFIEFGVENYEESNTKFLLLNKNWEGFIMDSSSNNINHIKNSELYWKHSLKAVISFVNKENINDLLELSKFDKKIGLLSIDIDGNDYWVWKEIDKIEPSIVIIEYNARLGIEKPYVVPYEKNFERKKANYSMIYYGASLKALVKLGKKKGYELVHCNKAGNNAFFVKKELLNDKIKSIDAVKGFVDNKFRESRDKKGKLIFLNKKSEEEILFKLPLEEV